MKRTYARSCRDKHRHPSFGAAEAHVRALQKHSTDPHVDQIAPYFCGFCRGYHVGHRSRSQWDREHAERG